MPILRNFRVAHNPSLQPRNLFRKKSPKPPPPQPSQSETFEEVPQPPPQHYEELILSLYYNPHFPNLPWFNLTLLRFIQLVEIYVSMMTLQWNGFVLGFLKGANVWWVMLAVAIHIFFWLLEENVVRTTTSKLTLKLGMVIVSWAYTFCCSIIIALLYTQYGFTLYVPFTVAFISVIYFGYHLHWVSQLTLANMLLERSRVDPTQLYVNRRNMTTTRPETVEDRLHIGPKLVCPKPEEYSVPAGYP